MVPPRKRKMVRTCPSTTSLSIGNCIIEFPSDADQELTTETLCLQVNQFAVIKLSVDKLKTQAPETPRPCSPGSVQPSELSFQLINPKSLDEINHELLERTTKLYKQELPAMSFAADTGKESDFLRHCTMNGKYCTLLMKKSGLSLADPEIVVGAITYQILPTSTQYAEIPLAAVDQTCQRQGLGSLLVKELARRLTDVGVLTLFCWGDQESERFWNKQGFLKIAEVDAQGKPQKLRLKNEIRKAMSLPGNSALMVCNTPQVGTPTQPVSAGDISPFRTRGTTNAVHTSEKEVKTTFPVEAQQPPIAPSDVSNIYSFENIPSEAPLSSDASPAASVTLISSPNLASADLKPKTYARGSSSKLSTNPTLASKPTSAKANCTLRFSGVDSITTTEKGMLENATVRPPGQVVEASICESSAAVFNPCTRRIIEDRVSPASPIDTVTHSDVKFRESLRNMENNSVNDFVAPVKKRPWKRTQCDNPNVAAATQEPQSTGSEFGLEKENQVPGRVKVEELDCEGNDGRRKSCLKRPRAETLQVKTIGRRSVRKRRGESPSPINPLFQTPEPSLPEPSPISEKPQAAQKAETFKYGAVRNSMQIATSPIANVVDCKQSMADESFSPSVVGEDHLSLGFEKHGKGSVIRKRLSTRLVHVPDIGENSHLASGYRKDSATATTPIVFLSGMPNDPKKRALAQLVEKLGGKVTGDGGDCTHVITSEVRRTVNFCTALCNGAWVVTLDWLKASNRHKSFVDERSYILRDKQFESKYKVSLASVIQAAQRKPGALFTGFSVYPTHRVQPPLQTVSKLTQVAGGKILSSLDEALQQKDLSHIIVLVGEEKEEEGVIASKAGLRTFTGEWLLQAIVKQRIDFDSKFPGDH